MRAAFGDDLFVRTGSGMEPTSLCRALAPELEDILASVERISALSDRFDPATTTDTLRISCSDFFQNALLMRTIAQVKSQAPGLRLAFHPYQHDRGIEQLKAGDVDILIAQTACNTESIVSGCYCRDELVVVFGAAHPMSSNQALSVEDFVGCDRVEVATETETNSHIAAALTKLDRPCLSTLSLSSFAPLAPLLNRGHHIAVVPSNYVKLYRQFFAIEERPLPFAIPPLAMHVIRHRRNQADPLIKWMLTHIETSFGTAQPHNSAN